MRWLPSLALAAAGVVAAGCGTTRENRFNETAYADHPPRQKIVYRAPTYSEQYYSDHDVEVVYVRPAYRVIPRGELIYGGDGYYYYRD